MKIFSKNINDDGQGYVTLNVNDGEDLWHLYNLIAVGDIVHTTTVRKIQRETVTGSTESERKKLKIKISVISVDYDMEGQTIRISGKNVEENKYVKVGAHHTVEIDLDVNPTLTLSKEVWDSVSRKRLEDACSMKHKDHIAAVIMQEGKAHIVIITSVMTLTKAHITYNIPRKKSSSTSHDKAMKTFFHMVYDAMLKYIDFAAVECIILAGPGFINEEFQKEMLQKAILEENKQVLESKSKMVLVKTSTGHVRSLLEVLKDDTVLALVKDAKAAKEVKVLNEFFKQMREDSEKVAYGKKHVFEASEQRAIEKLIIADSLLRVKNINQRKEYTALCEDVKKFGGKVYVLSSHHVSGEELEKYTGIVAILRFPLPEYDFDEEEEEEEVEGEEANDNDK